MLEVSLVRKRTALTDFCFCLAGPPTVSFHTKARRDKKSTKHKSTFSYWQVRIRRGVGGGWERSCLLIKTELILTALYCDFIWKRFTPICSSSHFQSVSELVQHLSLLISTETNIQTYLIVTGAWGAWTVLDLGAKVAAEALWGC